MKEQLPVNPSILKWARKTIGLSETDVAKKIKKPVEIIKEWETGKSAPSYPVLEKLAYQIYKRPVAVFFFPEVPKEDNLKADFRTLPEEILEDIPSEIIKIYRKAKVFQINLSELYDGKKPADVLLTDRYKIDLSTDVKALANKIRNDLKVDSAEQIQWESYDTAFKEWRNLLESQGVFIFKDAFHNHHFSGLCVYDPYYPIIFINNSMPKSRQIFTMFHELAHLLFKSGGVDVPSEEYLKRLSGRFSKIEVMCNEFAGEFLLPDALFRMEKKEFSEAQLSELADKYKVSKEVVLRNYLDFKIIDDQTYSGFVEKWKEEYKKSKSKKAEGGDYYATQKVYLGDNYIFLAFSKYFQEKISIEGLADYLGIKVKHIPAFENHVLR